MSPQTRSNLKKRAAVSVPFVKWGKTSLQDLPLEILGEIISHLPVPLPIPPTTIEGGFNTMPRRLARNSECFKRIDTLRALSVTCRSLRTFALPLAWERIEVCSSKFSTSEDNAKANKELSSQLSRHLTVATSKKAGIAGFVKIVNVILVRDACSKAGLRRLARALESFTRLHTIQISGFCRRDDFSLEAFQGKTFRNVKTLVVSELLLPLFKCCPAVTYVNITHQYVYCMPTEVQDTIPDYALDTLGRGVEEFIPPRTFFNTDAVVKRFVDIFKNLVVLNLFEDFMMAKIMPANSIDHFKNLPNLQCIRIFTEEGRGIFDSGVPDLNDDSVVRGSENAREVHRRVIEVLRGFAPRPDGGHTCIILSLQGKGQDIHDVISGQCPASMECRFYRETPKYTYKW